MRKIFLFCVTAALTLLAASCRKEEPSVFPEETAGSNTLKVYPVTLSLAEDDFASADGDTKSQIGSSSEAIQRATLFAMGSDGKVLLREDAGGKVVPIAKTVSGAAQAASFTWDLPVASFTIYAMANYDDATATTLAGYTTNVSLTTTMLNALTYTNSSTTFLTTIPSKGMPAAGTKSVNITSPGGSIGTVSIKRLFARYDIKFNTDHFTSNGCTVTATAIESVSSPSSASWFQAGVQPGSGTSYTALDSATSSDKANVATTGCTLYVLENCQGTRSGFANWYDVQFATSDVLAGITNILINTTYTNASGLTRKASCRVYLGGDCRTDFNVRRGVRTDLNLALREGIGREVYLGDGSTIVSGPGVVHVVPFYTTLTSKDDLVFACDNWLTLGAVTFGANSGSVHSECGYAGTVTYTVNSNARADSDKKIYVNGKSRDKNGTVVYTEIYDEAKVHFPYSFTYSWAEDTAPDHLAQRGVLTCIDRYTGAASGVGVFTANDAGIILGDYSTGAKTVSLKGAFALRSDAIHIEAPNGEGAVNVPLEARVPWFECTDLSPATNYIDAQGSMTFTYLQAASNGAKTSTKMKVVNNGTGADVTAVCAGNNLDLKLVNELIAPEMTSTAGRLYFDRNTEDANADGSLTIFTHVHTYEGVAALITSAKTFTADSGKVFITGHGSDRGQHAFTFNSWNPWYFWYQAGSPVAEFGVMNDYSLYHEPANWSGEKAKTGWESNPSYRPVETASYSSLIPNAMVSKPENLKLNVTFQETGGYMGHKVAQGEPGIVGPDFTPSTLYRTYITVNASGNYDWEALGNYLWFNLGHYLPGAVWTRPGVTDAERRAEVESLVAAQPGRRLVITSWRTSATAALDDAFIPDGGILGVTFNTESRTVSSTWNLICSMTGLEDKDVNTRSAGKVDIVMQVVNPYNSESPTLDLRIANAYIRLHLYVWPAASGVTTAFPGWHDTGSGWGYYTFPYCFTDGKEIRGLEGFWSKQTLISTTEVHTNNTTAILKSNSASIGIISRNLTAISPAFFQFYNNAIFNSYWSDTRLKDALMTELKGNEISQPFTFRNANNISRDEIVSWEQYGSSGSSWTDNKQSINYDGLNTILGAGTFYKQGDYTLYYDPSGTQYKYTYPGGRETTTDKLFVIHLGDERFSRCYYFDTYFGFRDQN